MFRWLHYLSQSAVICSSVTKLTEPYRWPLRCSRSMRTAPQIDAASILLLASVTTHTHSQTYTHGCITGWRALMKPWWMVSTPALRSTRGWVHWQLESCCVWYTDRTSAHSHPMSGLVSSWWWRKSASDDKHSPEAQKPTMSYDVMGKCMSDIDTLRRGRNWLGVAECRNLGLSRSQTRFENVTTNCVF